MREESARLMSQAAGLIPIVHASAGPKLDIVVPQGGQTTGESKVNLSTPSYPDGQWSCVTQE